MSEHIPSPSEPRLLEACEAARDRMHAAIQRDMAEAYTPRLEAEWAGEDALSPLEFSERLGGVVEELKRLGFRVRFAPTHSRISGCTFEESGDGQGIRLTRTFEFRDCTGEGNTVSFDWTQAEHTTP
jgi:hypothetical protein